MLDALYPPLCPACATGPSQGLCAPCRSRLSLRPVASPPQPLHEVFVIDRYQGPVGTTLARAKASGNRQALRRLGRTLAELARDHVRGPWFDAVVPCPSPWTRRARRGFAPGHVVAEQVARVAGRPLRACLGVARGRRQSTLSRRARAHNLSGRLRLSSPVAGHVLLVDDVLTTGATLQACAELLLAGGATGVWGLAICNVRSSRADAVSTSRTSVETP